MLNAKTLESLLNAPIKCDEGRLMRLMSCDNPIKTIYIFHHYDSSVQGSFECKVKASILEFSKMVDYLLKNEGNVDRDRLIGVNKVAILPTRNIIKNALYEIANWIYLLKEILVSNDITTLYSDIYSLSMINYIVLTSFCGITDFSKNINNSRTLRRFINFQKESKQFIKGDIHIDAYLKEVANHKQFLEETFRTFFKYDLLEEDFLAFILLFDIRKNRNMVNNK